MKYTDEAIVSALIMNGTISAAAEKLGISQRTINGRMKDPDFLRMYQDAKTEVLRGIIDLVSANYAEAMETVVETTRSAFSSKRDQLHACKIIIDAAIRLAEVQERNEHDGFTESFSEE